MEDAQRVLDYWFGELENGFTKDNRGALWYGSSTDTDTAIKKEFGELVQKATNKELDDWKITPQGRCALIILLDQFTRNMFRKTKEAFAADAYAVELCKEGITLGHDEQLPPIQRAFLYHPLEHSEQLSDQELSVEMFTKLVDGLSPGQKERAKGFLTYAKEHRDIVAQFGRFPHRNHVMGRASTPEEEEYLKTGQRFGQ